MKKLLGFLMIVTMLLSSVNYTFANETADDYLKNLAKEMITPTIGDVSNPKFREDTRKNDLKVIKEFYSLSESDKKKVLNFMNGDKVRYQTRSSEWCPYEKFPRIITIKDPQTAGNAHIYYGTFTSAVTNNPNGEYPCDNKIWFSTSKPYIWGTTIRARAYLWIYGDKVNKKTENGKDYVILGGLSGLPLYGTGWFDIHNEMIIWG